MEVENFGGLGLTEKVLAAVRKMGIEVPIEIQCIGIPMVLEGKTVVIGSHTGSSKTLAYMLPLAQGVVGFGHVSQRRGGGELDGIGVNVEERKMRVWRYTRDYPANETLGTQKDPFTPHFDGQIDRLGWQDPIGITCEVKGCNCLKKKFTDPIAIEDRVQARLQLKTL
ncbi:PREDICTED: DEAD-box ATP-dependent RNA [Prunus dulcis]|uniref:PREDICTED: DEAD-box ATP-dependent RNA n=1 Tax=Prunus dulcis TaxID=3755 RepID=A0A5E4G6L2_PRUDU|nr:PREDICTED: DEAD-box ATP-dependent RNA [Prunus dulcis]